MRYKLNCIIKKFPIQEIEAKSFCALNAPFLYVIMVKVYPFYTKILLARKVLVQGKCKVQM